MQQLRTLKAGTFYGFGPAISDVVTEIKVGPVATTHPKAGERAAPPTPPRDRVKKILAQLADLPHEAEEEAKTATELRAKVRQLEADLRKAKTAMPAPKIEKVGKTKTVEKFVLKEILVARIEKAIARGEALYGRVAKMLGEGVFDAKLHLALTLAREEMRLYRLGVPAKASTEAVRPPVQVVKTPRTASRAAASGDNGHAKVSNGALPIGESAVLRALIQYSNGLHKKQLGVLTGYKRSTRDAYVQRLRERGYVVDNGDKVAATEDGIAALPDAAPLPVGEELREFWMQRLASGERAILKLLTQRYPEPVEKPEIDEVTGFKRSTRDAYLSRLAAKELVIESGRGAVVASNTLFEVA